MSTTYTLTCGHEARAAAGLPGGRRLHCLTCPPDGERRMATQPIKAVGGSNLGGGDLEAWLAGQVEEYLRHIGAGLDELADKVRAEARKLDRTGGAGPGVYTEIATSVVSALTNGVNNLHLTSLIKVAAEADMARTAADYNRCPRCDGKGE